jgi:deoxyinosine 3'endonuclease (endonuclease V)
MTEDWSVRLIALQNEMRIHLDRTSALTDVTFVGGCDLTVDGGLMVGCFVVVDVTDSYRSVYEKCTIVDVDVPYIPGLLSFREGPVVLQCLREFRGARPDLRLDALLVDGCGEWHPRGFGLACFVGLEAGVPTIGVSKTFLNTGSGHSAKQVQADAQPACSNVGDVMMLTHALEDGVQIACAVMRSTASAPFQPIYISVGHLISIESAVQIVRRLCRFREPEPLRLADRISRTFVREMKNQRPKG